MANMTALHAVDEGSIPHSVAIVSLFYQNKVAKSNSLYWRIEMAAITPYIIKCSTLGFSV